MERFEAQTINHEAVAAEEVTPEEQKMNATHEETVRMVGELNLQDYGVTADELKDLASKARESNKEEQVNAFVHWFKHYVMPTTVLVSKECVTYTS